MRRTIGSGTPIHCSIWSRRMPAAIETISGRASPSVAWSPAQTSRMTCGFTASRTVVAFARASNVFACVATRKSRASAERGPSSGSATAIERASTPARINAPIRLRAMLPPPMKAVWPGFGIRDSGMDAIVASGRRDSRASIASAHWWSATAISLSRLRERVG